ncbi:MAG: hypothetical protein IPG89_17820 [Bacteroidetes bacterium]|nr:hypothetical protein [Bacteroidota bacterium]
MGNFDPNLDDLNDSKKSIMQANVYFSETKTDWNDSKTIRINKMAGS